MKLTPIEDALISAGSGAAVIGGAAKVHAGILKRIRRWRVQRMYERGVKGVPGMTPTVEPGAVRTATLEGQMQCVQDEIKTMSAALAGMATTVVEGFAAMDKRIDLLFGTGEETNSPGDLTVRIARANGVYREDVGHSRP